MNTADQMHNASQGQELASGTGDLKQKQESLVTAWDEVKTGLKSKEELQDNVHGLVDAVKHLRNEATKGAEDGKEAARDGS